MIAVFRPGGETPVTPPPRMAVKDGRLSLVVEQGASIGFRIDGGPWRVYARPIEVSGGSTVEARAVRYGWKESESVELSLP